MNEMKKLFWLLSVAALIATYGCSEEEETFVEEDVVGVWVVTGASPSFSIGEMSFVDYLIQELQYSELDAKAMEVAMKEEFSQGFEGTVDMKADYTYLAEFGDDPAETGAWELIEGIKLKLLATGESEPTELRIISLSSSTMVLEFDEFFSADMNQDGTDEEITVLIEMSFSKQQ